MLGEGEMAFKDKIDPCIGVETVFIDRPRMFESLNVEDLFNDIEEEEDADGNYEENDWLKESLDAGYNSVLFGEL